MDHLCYLYLVLVKLSRLFFAALWSPAGKWLISWLLFVMLFVFCHFPCCILGQVWYLIVSIPDLCRFSFFVFPVHTYFLFELEFKLIKLLQPHIFMAVMFIFIIKVILIYRLPFSVYS